MPEIDGLRFVAIAVVVLYHWHGFVALNPAVPAAGDSFRAVVAHGYRGVNLFYVISGFILGLPFAAHCLDGRPKVSLRAYFLRRLTRLEPPYILNLLGCFALLVLVDGASSQVLLPHLGASLLYMHSLWFGEHSLINPVAWTLEVEVQFYCLAPVLAQVFRIGPTRLRRAALVLAVVSAGVLQTMWWDGPARVTMSILFAIQFFLAGFLLADVYVLDWAKRPAPGWMWDAVSLVCWPIIFLMGDREGWVWLPLLMLAAAAGAFRSVVFNRLFSNLMVTTIGGMCYTIYLLHYQLIPVVLRFSKSVHAGDGFNAYFAVQCLIYLPILLLASGVFFLLIERPCMATGWPQRGAQRLKRWAGWTSQP